MSNFPEEELILNISCLENLLENVGSEKYLSPAKLRRMYRNMCKIRELLFQIKKRRDDDRTLKKVEKLNRILTHFLLERCYWIRYGDSAVVRDLLKALFEVDGHLGKIFDYQQLCIRPKARSTHSCGRCYQTTWTEETLSSEEVKPFSYFLEHANKMKILFVNQRLTEVSFAQGILSERSLILPPYSKTFIFPEILTQLLEYGLFANAKPNEDDIGKLVTGVIGVILNSDSYSLIQNNGYTSSIIKVGNILLRAVPHIKLSSLLQDQKLRNKTPITRRIVEQMSTLRLLPKLMVRCTGPQELQHLCRRVIRQALYDNWLLPHGITLLPIPSLMKDYINLEFDFFT